MRFTHGLAVLSIGLGIGLAGAVPAAAQGYPERVVTVIAPSAPGGQFSNYARLVAAHMEKAFGRPFIVENRPGAAQRTGMVAVARAIPDGHTIAVVGSTGMAMQPAIHKDLPYDPVNDYVPIGLLASFPEVLIVHESVPAKTVDELAAYAKTLKPGTLAYSSAGAGTQSHFSGALLAQALGIEMTHVPYKGIAPAVNDVVAGHVSFMFAPVPVAMPLVASGRIRTIGVAVSERLPTHPDLPTLAEQGLKGLLFRTPSWFILVAPAKTPQSIIEQLHAEVRRMFDDSKFREALVNTGAIPFYPQPPLNEVSAFVRREIKQWAETVQQAKFSSN